jgi:hypothetical protein
MKEMKFGYGKDGGMKEKGRKMKDVMKGVKVK